jgi:hypothetical protein
MDALRRDDIERARATPPEEKARQALEAMRTGAIPVARAEELLAPKVLSMTDRRPQDGIDAESLVAMNPSLDVDAVRELLAKVVARGFHRGQDLGAKLDQLLARARASAHPPPTS